jgi:hypothetical protein
MMPTVGFGEHEAFLRATNPYLQALQRSRYTGDKSLGGRFYDPRTGQLAGYSAADDPSRQREATDLDAYVREITQRHAAEAEAEAAALKERQQAASRAEIIRRVLGGGGGAARGPQIAGGAPTRRVGVSGAPPQGRLGTGGQISPAQTLAAQLRADQASGRGVAGRVLSPVPGQAPAPTQRFTQITNDQLDVLEATGAVPKDVAALVRKKIARDEAARKGIIEEIERRDAARFDAELGEYNRLKRNLERIGPGQMRTEDRNKAEAELVEREERLHRLDTGRAGKEIKPYKRAKEEEPEKAPDILKLHKRQLGLEEAGFEEQAEEIRKQIDEIINPPEEEVGAFEGSQLPSDVPDASELPGRVIRIPGTGQVFRSDGTNWVPESVFDRQLGEVPGIG